MTLYDSIKYLHIAAGTIALAAFWTAATLRKGSGGHRLVGRTYMVSILVVAVSGVPLALAAFGRNQPVLGTFLLYLLLITATPAWNAWRAVRIKTDVRRYAGPVFRVLAWLNIAAGAVVVALGARYDVLLLAVFGLIGPIVGALMLKFASAPPADRRWWLVQHYSSILGAGVATHVAFLNLGLARLLPTGFDSAAQRLSFFVPLLISVLARLYLNRKYGARAHATTLHMA